MLKLSIAGITIPDLGCVDLCPEHHDARDSAGRGHRVRHPRARPNLLQQHKPRSQRALQPGN